MGSDTPFHRPYTTITSFNSRSRMGSDWLPGLAMNAVARFQFALPHGERQSLYIFKTGRALFQFALPHGERRFSTASSIARSTFQFALPHGERQLNPISKILNILFQFALPHGERLDTIFATTKSM